MDTKTMFVAALAGLLGMALVKLFSYLRKRDAEKEAREILDRANIEAANRRKEAEIEAREIGLQEKAKGEELLNASRQKIHERERQLDKLEDTLQTRSDQLGKQEKMVEGNQRRLAEKLEDAARRQLELDKLLDLQRQTLHRVSGLEPAEAKRMLLERLDKELAHEQGALIVKQQKAIVEACEAKGREVLIASIQRFAAAHTAESTTSTVDIPSDEMKGRIIGREGRNIRAFEKATGVDVIVDDTPGVVVVSAFDSVRRETAKQALVKLIQDGRIHPTRIDEVVLETQKEMDEFIRKQGNEAAQEAEVPGLHEKLLDLMGRLYFRTSYSQNVLRHSIEVAHLTGLMAEQLGLNATLARRCGFLHDIGKAADHEMEGGHPAVGAELLKRYGEKVEVVHAARGHHDDIRVDYIYTVLVAAADACSASRPGARRETLEKYVRRLEELEAIACGFPGVEQAYAVQAGREVRVVVNPSELNDREAAKMCRDIATAIEQQMTYPGEVKVTVLRETRVVEYAR